VDVDELIINICCW